MVKMFYIAEKTIVWLGQKTDDSNEAMAFLEWLAGISGIRRIQTDIGLRKWPPEMDSTVLSGPQSRTFSTEPGESRIPNNFNLKSTHR